MWIPIILFYNGQCSCNGKVLASTSALKVIAVSFSKLRCHCPVETPTSISTNAKPNVESIDTNVISTRQQKNSHQSKVIQIGRLDKLLSSTGGCVPSRHESQGNMASRVVINYVPHKHRDANIPKSYWGLNIVRFLWSHKIRQKEGRKRSNSTHKYSQQREVSGNSSRAALLGKKSARTCRGGMPAPGWVASSSCREELQDCPQLGGV